MMPFRVALLRVWLAGLDEATDLAVIVNGVVEVVGASAYY